MKTKWEKSKTLKRWPEVVRKKTPWEEKLEKIEKIHKEKKVKKGKCPKN